MTVNTASIQTSYAGNGTTTEFALAQAALDQDDIEVVVRDDTTLVQTVQVLGSDYTLNSGLDTVTFTTAPASGVTVYITIKPAGLQEVSLPVASGLQSSEIQKGLDRLALTIDFMKHQLARAILLNDINPAYSDNELTESVADREDKFISFDASGNPTIVSVINASLITITSFMETLLDDANAAAARTTLGATTDLSVSAGLQSKYIPVVEMAASTTNGAAAGQVEGASGNNFKTLDFDTTTQEFACFNWKPPKSWNEGTLTYRVYWSAASGSGGVTWGLEAAAASNDDPHNVTFGTVIDVDDTLIATADLHLTPLSAALTPGGTPAEDDLLFFRLKRQVADANDTIAADVQLIGVELFWTKNADTDD